MQSAEKPLPWALCLRVGAFLQHLQHNMIGQRLSQTVPKSLLFLQNNDSQFYHNCSS
jgi:hypothetical protein